MDPQRSKYRSECRSSVQEKKDKASWNPGGEMSADPNIRGTNATVCEANPIAVMPSDTFDKASEGQSK
jgi:hypothetical protein